MYFDAFPWIEDSCSLQRSPSFLFHEERLSGHKQLIESVSVRNISTQPTGLMIPEIFVCNSSPIINGSVEWLVSYRGHQTAQNVNSYNGTGFPFGIVKATKASEYVFPMPELVRGGSAVISWSVHLRIFCFIDTTRKGWEKTSGHKKYMKKYGEWNSRWLRYIKTKKLLKCKI